MGRKNQQRAKRVQRPKVLRIVTHSEKVAHRAAINPTTRGW